MPQHGPRLYTSLINLFAMYSFNESPPPPKKEWCYSLPSRQDEAGPYTVESRVGRKIANGIAYELLKK